MNVFATIAFFTVTALMLFSGCSLNIEDQADQVLYPFDKVDSEYAVPIAPPREFQQVVLQVRSVDGTTMDIRGWYHEARGSADHVLVYLHGNGENLQALYQSQFLQRLMDLNMDFLAIDYPGLGGSTGFPNEPNLVRSAEAAINWTRKHFGNRSLVLWGRSLGAAVAVQVANRHEEEIEGLILTSPWTSMMDVAQSHNSLAKRLPEDWVKLNSYDSAAVASRIRVPVLVHHGTLDDLIPVQQARLLNQKFENTNVKMIELTHASHNDVFLYEEVWQSVRSFRSQPRTHFATPLAER